MIDRYTEDDLQARMDKIIDLGRQLRGPSLAELLSLCGEQELPGIDSRHVRRDWKLWGRPKQLVFADPDLPDWYPGERKRWRVALALGGRALGKTYMGSNTSWHRIEHHRAKSLCFVGATWKDVRRIMVGGKPDTESGFLDILPPEVRRETRWNKNDQEIHVHPYGATIYLNSAEDQEQRGGNFDWIWGDEPIKWRRLHVIMSNLLLSLRKRGGRTQMLLTTTPKPYEWLKDMIMDGKTLVVHGESHENASNMDPDFLADEEDRIGGTSLGDQELLARVLGKNSSALLGLAQIDRLRVVEAPDLVEVGIGIDPAVSTRRYSDDTGIVAAGRCAGNELYALQEQSGRFGADEWPEHAAEMAKAWGASFIVIERNKIGDAGVVLLQKALERAGMLAKVEIREAYAVKYHNKWVRAEPVAVLYTDRHMRAHHVGHLPSLEHDLTQWDPDSSVSPNTLDAYVHVATDLLGLAKIAVQKKPDAFAGFEEANAAFASGNLDPLNLRRRGRRGFGGGRGAL